MRPPAPADDANRPTVVLVDPDERFRAVLGQLLHDHGYRVVMAVNYAQAIVASRREDPAVIVTELRNGQVLTPDAYIQALRRHTPARLILHSDVLPSPFELQAWGLWGAVVKGEPTRRLLDLVATACMVGRKR